MTKKRRRRQKAHYLHGTKQIQVKQQMGTLKNKEEIFSDCLWVKGIVQRSLKVESCFWRIIVLFVMNVEVTVREKESVTIYITF